MQPLPLNPLVTKVAEFQAHEPCVFGYIGIAFCIALVIACVWVGITWLARYDYE